MRNFALVITAALFAACEDDGIVTNNPDQPGNDPVVEEPLCLQNSAVDAYMDGSQFWQLGASGALCWNDPSQPNDPDSWGCINPGSYTRASVASQLPVGGQQALDCACSWQLGGGQGDGYTGSCDVALATYLDWCAGATPESVWVTYEAPWGADCVLY